MVTKTATINTASPTTIMAGLMEKPPGVGGRSGSASACPASRVSVSCSVMAHPAYGRADHPKWSTGPCPEPRRQPAPPASARCTNSLAAVIASSTVSPWASACRDRRRQRTAGAVVVARLDPCARQHRNPFGADHDVVRRFGEVASLHDHPAGAPPPDLFSHGDSGVERDQRLHRRAAQHGGLAQVRRRNQRLRQQPLEVGRSSLRLQERVTGGRDEHGVHHEGREAALLGETGHFGHDAAVGQHAGLHAAHLEVVEDGLDLQSHERRIEGDDTTDPCCVLGRNRGERAGAVDTQRRESLEVRLRARTTSRVRASDRQRGRRGGDLRHLGHDRRAPEVGSFG